jgi:hypothetical protein
MGPTGLTGAQGAMGFPGPAGASPFALNAGNAVFTTGSVGLGTTAPTQVLDVWGNVNVNGYLALNELPFLHRSRALGTVGYNTFLGESAGNLTTPAQASSGLASFNTGIGWAALWSIGSGASNTALGYSTLRSNTLGNLNTAMGSLALWQNTTAGTNTAIGSYALSSQSFDNGGVPWDAWNTAIGFNALAANQPTSITTGDRNTAVGAVALRNNTTGRGNTAVGVDSLQQNTTGYLNTSVGFESLLSNGTGTGNVALGSGALRYNDLGHENTAIGGDALYTLSGLFNSGNVALGGGALRNLGAGDSNIAIGWTAGQSLGSGSSNIYIGSFGGGSSETGFIRIGANGKQSKAFMAGVYGATTQFAGVPVVMDLNGQLGTVSSSLRYKEDVQDMGVLSDRLFGLRPVTFKYKAQVEGPIHFGLIAEEVAEILPELVIHGQGGRIETVAYHELAPMLLNELQKQRRQIEALKAELAEIHAALSQRK